MYKTISFPRQESGTGQLERLRIASEAVDGFASWVASLSSRELRNLLNGSYADLARTAGERGVALCELAQEQLMKAYDDERLQPPTAPVAVFPEQFALFSNDPPLGKHGTFSPNHLESIHRWYPYIEGFSATFVRRLIEKWGPSAKSLYDPFAGTGTAMTVAAMMGVRGYFSEINPFMRLVIDAKTNGLRDASRTPELLRKYLIAVLGYAVENPFDEGDAQADFARAFGKRPFFAPSRLAGVLSIRNAITQVEPPFASAKTLATVALGSIAVACSEMKRAADLRYRVDAERLPKNFSVFDEYRKKIQQIIDDVDSSFSGMEPVQLLGENALELRDKVAVDLIVTSPPYLNGTNYFRNTKIELWLTGQIASESDLGKYTRAAVTAGINNVASNGRSVNNYEFVEKVARKLDKVAYDVRIPELVRRYCSDASLWLANCHSLLKSGGRLVLDIGDSKFAGVHVPTDDFLLRIAESVGFSPVTVEPVRSRVSKDGSALKQVLLVFEKKGAPTKRLHRAGPKRVEEVERLAKAFERELPHKAEPYASRNWGNPLHSLCSYQGKLKPAIAHFLVTRFTEPGQVVLDPLAGAGTIPLEAFANGRHAIANDLQELGFYLSFAKVRKPQREVVESEVTRLVDFVKRNRAKQDLSKYARFGFNGGLAEYFHPETFGEVLAAREYMLGTPCDLTERALVYSCVLHLLHGNRPYALSRQSHPVTPFKPQGRFEYRPLEQRLYEKVARSLAAHDIPTSINGDAFRGSFEDLSLDGDVDAVITSPPFAASTRFYVANWMRLWMAGWEPEHFDAKRERFIEHRQKASFDVYSVFFERCAAWLRPGGLLIMHVGKTAKCDMGSQLVPRSQPYFALAHQCDENVLGREKFGIRDQGATGVHQYLFFVKQ